MKKQKPQPQPPVFTEVQKQELAKMEKFRQDMKDIDPDANEGSFDAFRNDPFTFKYLHAQFLYKVWCAGGRHQ